MKILTLEGYLYKEARAPVSMTKFNPLNWRADEDCSAIGHYEANIILR